MAGSFANKVQGDNRHLQNITSARFVHYDGSTSPTQVVAAGVGCRLLRVILNTTGTALTLRSGSRVIGIISATATTGSYYYGVYCDNGLIIEGSGTVDATVVFG